jgi:predicted transposase YdaD
MSVATEQDSSWKEILDQYFPEFMEFFFPQIHRDIDWSRPPEFLDKELEQLFNDGLAGKRMVDKLVKVYRLDAKEPTWLLIHLEIQGYADPTFAQRMFIYHYRLYDRYFQPKGIEPGEAGRLDKIISLAVLTDSNKRYRPKRFVVKGWGFELSFKFPSVKLMDYNKDWAGLEANPNPFAVVTMAVLKAQQDKKKPPEERLTSKLGLTRLLYQRKYSRQQIIDLYRFIDSIVRLPEELDQAFRQEVTRYEEEKRMPYVSSIERLGRQDGLKEGLEKGLEKGRQEGTLTVILRLLRRKFGEQEPEVEQQLSALSLTQLEDLGEAILDFSDRADLAVWLQSQGKPN